MIHAALSTPAKTKVQFIPPGNKNDKNLYYFCLLQDILKQENYIINLNISTNLASKNPHQGNSGIFMKHILPRIEHLTTKMELKPTKHELSLLVRQAHVLNLPS